MQSRFVVPVIVATAFHALVFFGFNPSRVPKLIAPSEARAVLPPVPESTIEIVVDQPLPPDPSTEPKPEQKGSRQAFKPQDPELPQLPGDWAVLPTPISPPSKDKISIITPEVWGNPESDTDEVPDRPVISVDYLDNPPRTRSQVAPAYPPQAKSIGLNGEVTVEFVVDEAGRVINARVLKSTNSMFEVPTLNAVNRWRFEPGKRTGRPVRFRMVAPVVFNLEN